MTIRWRSLALAGLLGLSRSAAAEPPPPAGSPAPPFALPDATGTKRYLAEWKGKWLVLYFYPRDNTPGCTREAINFRDRLPRFAALNAQVVGVSLDEGTSHQAFAADQRLPFPLLSDSDGAVARRYGALTNLGVVKFAKRRTFLIDPDGRVAKAYLDVDAGRHADEVLADLEALGAK